MGDAEEKDVQEEEAPKRKKPDPRLPVKVVCTKGESSLVEWLDSGGMYRRAYVPISSVADGTVSSADLEAGVPYGLPWEKFIKVEATPESLANELRRQGIWEWEDIKLSALQNANRAFDLGAFMRKVEQEVKKT
jgi:hypothetical protein